MKWQPFFNFFILADTDILVPATFRKPETQTLGVGNLKFFRTIDIYEMAAIFQFFSYWPTLIFCFRQHLKTGDPNFGG